MQSQRWIVFWFGIQTLYYCTLCSKDIIIDHEGWADITRHINGNAHKEEQEAKRKQPEIDSIFLKPSNPLESQR